MRIVLSVAATLFLPGAAAFEGPRGTLIASNRLGIAPTGTWSNGVAYSPLEHR